MFFRKLLLEMANSNNPVVSIDDDDIDMDEDDVDVTFIPLTGPNVQQTSTPIVASDAGAQTPTTSVS